MLIRGSWVRAPPAPQLIGYGMLETLFTQSLQSFSAVPSTND